MPNEQEKAKSVSSSQYSGTDKAGETAKEVVMIDPNKAKQAISSGDSTKRDREARKQAKKADK